MRQGLSILLLLIGSANAADLTVTDDDQKAIASICELAAQRPGMPIQQTANIANWCVIWANRVQAAEKAKAEKKEDKP